MENNIGTVKLSLEEYNKLRDYKSAIENNDCIIIRNGLNNQIYRIISTDDAVKLIANDNKSLSEKYDSLKLKLYKCENHIKSDPTISEVRRMSIWQFFKWKMWG